MGKISKSYLKEVAERKKYQSGGFSTEGYKRNSPDVNNPYNVIPSNQITMRGVDFPVLGVDNFGNRQLMEPGNDYTFPGNYVKEFPLRNMGNNRFQTGGAKSPVILPQIDYDLEKAPKQGNFLLSDIDRPFYIDDDGQKRSEYKMGVNIEGKETLIPTVVNGTQLTEDQAIQRYYDTGLHMGQYDTVPEAEYASRMRTLKYNMLEDPVRFGTNYQAGGTKKPIPRYVENRYGYNNTTDNTYVRPYTPPPKPVSAQQVKPKALQIPPTPEDRYRKQVDNTVYNPPVKTLRETYETPGQIMEEFEREEAIKNTLSKVDGILPALDVATDIMQIGNFIPFPVTQGIGKVGNVAGVAIDTYQGLKALDQGDYGNAGLNLGSALLPFYLQQKGYLRPMNVVSNYKGTYRPLNYLPWNNAAQRAAMSPFINANRRVAGALVGETLYDAGLIPNNSLSSQFGGFRDNTQINNVNRNNLYTLDRRQFYQAGGTIPKYVEDRIRYRSTTDATRTTPVQSFPKPLSVPTTKTPTNLGNNYYRQANTRDETLIAPVSPFPKLTPAQILQQFEDAVQAEAEERQAQSLQAEREAAAKTKQAVEDWGDENAKFTFPAGYLQSSGTTKAWKDMDWREKAYVSGRNLGSWNAGNWTDYVNPVAILGSMAEGLGSAPYVARETDSVMPYVSAIANPLLMGRMAGSGAINPLSKNMWTRELTNKQFVNNLTLGVPGMIEHGVVNPVRTVLTNSGGVKKDIVSRLAGIPSEKTLPRLSPEELKAYRQIQEIGRIKAKGGSYAEQMQYALTNNLPEQHFQKIFSQSRRQAQDMLNSGYGEQQAARSASIRSSLNLQRPPTPSRIPIEGSDLDVDIISGNSYADSIQNFITNNNSVRDNVIQDIISNVSNELPPPPEYISFNEPIRGRTIIPGQERSRRTLFQTLGDDWNRYVDQKRPTSQISDSILKNLINKNIQKYPYYSGSVNEKVPSLFLNVAASNGDSRAMKNIYDKVWGSQKTVNSGDVFTGSTNTSHSSYLPQLKQVFKYNQGQPQFLGYKPMNYVGFLSRFGYGNEEIAAYLNSEIDEQIRRNILPKDILRPYEKGRDIMLPHYGIKQYQQGGLLLDNYYSYQMGGTIGIPGVNGQVVSSGPQPLSSVKKTRGSVRKDNKGNVKTMSPKAVNQVLKYSKQKPNKI